MKLLIIGATGNIGRLVTPQLAERHEVITAGKTSGDVLADISSASSITSLFERVQQIDACICLAGDSYTGSLTDMTDDDLNLGISHKLLGQVNLVRMGLPYLSDGGSFTLISGKMGDKPSLNAAGKAMVNGAVNSFVLAASLEMPRDIRINVVSPAKVADVPIQDLVDAFLKSIEGTANGEILRVNY